ncbi:hypothetical protein [Fulvivirga sediminis]|uniref:Lipoprotein n=1 Tax=Fulvivirga sediminis TaxID=2803949 RepID=A0A937F858_9BACT|nr:hypothetical protein [Fulvivirga sediminis]MBL3655828.1 hypothetical protein [Fulvivirga sediminis]
MKSCKIFKLLMGCIGIAMFFSCSDDNKDNPKPVAKGSVIITDNSTYGNILTDNKGITLYFFSKDTKGASVCENGCLAAWPTFYDEELTVGSGLSKSDFGTITRADGKKQNTYKGWPLYYYAPSEGIEDPGETKGENVGGVWFVAKPDYSIMIVSAQLVGADGKNYTSDYKEGNEEAVYFVDSEGKTLYAFKNDEKNTNNFTADDFSNNSAWPIYEQASLGAIPSVLSSNDFAVIEVADKKQLTYKGWPLYYFGQDAARGDNKGVSVPSPGVWPIVNSNTVAAPQPTVRPTIMISQNSEHGSIITDAQGRALYLFSSDVDGTSTCTGGCLNAWPVFYTEKVELAQETALSKDDFATITLAGGGKQTTYKGWPLYYFAPNADGKIESAGEVNGDGINGVWYVAKDYDLMIGFGQLVGIDGKNYNSEYEEGEGTTRFFTDANGRTLYAFINDNKDKNNYTADDFGNNSIWPIYNTELLVLPSSINVTDFKVIDVFGRSQLSYKGQPLYYFGSDTKRGHTKGVSVPIPGVWPIVNEDTSN